LKNLKNKELLKRARRFYDEKNYQESLTYLSQIIEIDSMDNELSENAFVMMGNIFHIQGQIGKAIKAFQKVIELNPDHIDASISLSILYNDIGKYEEGEGQFNKSFKNIKNSQKISSNSNEKIQINKKLSAKHYELAELYFSFDRFDEALAEFNKSIVLDPKNLTLQLKLAKVYSKKNFSNKAAEVLNKLKSENPEYIPGRIGLGVFLYGQGRVLDARLEWQKVLSLKPSNDEAKMYLSMSERADETAL